jgi:hypothetical protein
LVAAKLIRATRYDFSIRFLMFVSAATRDNLHLGNGVCNRLPDIFFVRLRKICNRLRMLNPKIAVRLQSPDEKLADT